MFERLATVVCVFLSAFLSCALTSAEFPSNPTYGTIFLYPDTSCKTMNTASSYVLDYCFGTGKYSCVNGTLTAFYYNEKPCTDVRNVIEYSGKCYSNGYSSQSGICGQSGGSNPYHEYPEQFVVLTYFTDEKCSTNKVISTKGVPNNYCSFSGGSFPGTSYKSEFPLKYIWSNSGSCEGAASSSTTYSTECLRSNGSGEFYENSFSRYSLTGP